MTAEETLTISDETAEQIALPEGWRLVRLGDVCSFIYGSSLSTINREKGDVPVYGSNGLVGYHNQAITKGQTIIIGRKGSVGEVNFSTVACFPIDTTYFIDESATEIDLRFLFYLLKSVNFKELNKSTAVPGLNREDAYAVNIPLPPTIEEQRRIAAVLDEQMKAVEQARRAVEEQLAAAKLLPNAFLRSVFESEDAQNWQKRKLGEVCENYTGTKDPRKTPETSFQYVDISSVDNTIKRITASRKLLGKDAPSRARQVIFANDVIVATTRPNLNAVAFVSDSLNDEICSTGFCVLRSTELIDNNFLFAFTQSPLFVDSLSDLVKGALYPAVTDKQVKAQIIPLPPIKEQKEIAEKLNEQMQEVEKLKKTLTEQLEAIKKMPSALLRKAFAGEV